MRLHAQPAFRLQPSFRLLLWPGCIFATVCLLMALLFGVLARSGQLIYVWPITGVQLGLLLHAGSGDARNDWPRPLGIAAGALALLLSGFVLHAPFGINLVEALLQSAELYLLLRVLGPHIHHFDDLKRRDNAVRLFLAAFAFPTLTALALFSQHSTPGACACIIMADSLGIAIFVPVLLLLLPGKLLPRLLSLFDDKPAIVAALLLLGVTVAIFSQNTNPFLFMLFPPLILLVFRLGTAGATLTSVIVATVSSMATAHGHGPVWIARGVSLDHRILVLQLFQWTIVATALPVGALLDERRAAVRRATANQAIYETLLRNSENMIVLSNLDRSMRFVSPAVEKITGWTPEEFLALPPYASMHQDDQAAGQAIQLALESGHRDHAIRYRALRKDGGFCWVEAFLRGYADADGGPITGYVATIRDISAQKALEDSWCAEKDALADENRQLAHLAGRDELTTLANRRTFNQVLSMEAARQSRSSDSLSLLMIDVDHFKKYNDRYGHQAGDSCLEQVARVLDQCAARSSDLAARIGGEEFAILLPQTDEAGAAMVAALVLDRIRTLQLPHQDSRTGVLSVSIGAATWLPNQPSDISRLIEQADSALYTSKTSGRNRVTTWTGSRELTPDPRPLSV